MIYPNGTLVEVRTKEEILRTLDKNGRLEGLPFMPGMFAYCGKRFRVFKQVHKACDSVSISGGVQYTGRRMERTILLEGLRCDGLDYGNCDAACLLFWKEAWVKPVENEESSALSPPNYFGAKPVRCTEEEVWAGTRVPGESERYACQATQLTAATAPLNRWALGPYLKDLRSGNVKLGRMACSFLYVAYAGLVNSGLKIGRPLRAFYNFVQRLRGGVPFPISRGAIPLGGATPAETLNLQPGEWVRVKSHAVILATVDRYNRNRGMCFVADQVPYCGRKFRVLKRVDRIIDERSGRMIEMKTPAVMLEGAVCEGRYTDFCLFCPRSTYPYWREIWLERVAGPKGEMGKGL